MKHIVLFRTSQTKEALYGNMSIVEDGNILYTCKTIENRSKLCKAGRYPVRLEYSPRFKRKLWELFEVEGRSEIKIHVANFWNQLDGCIGVGLKHVDINKDGVIDLTLSKQALSEFHGAMGFQSESMITIVDVR